MTFAKSNEEVWLDALTDIVAALLAGVGDRIYPAHARDILPAVDLLMKKAREDGSDRLAKSLEHSRQRLAQIAPRQ